MNTKNFFILAVSILLLYSLKTNGKDLSPDNISVKYIRVSEDSWVSEEAPATNNNGITDMECGKMSTDTLGSREIFLKFDLHGLEGEIITTKLEIMSDQKIDEGWTRIDSFYIEVFGTSNAWEEESITWNNKPAALTGPLAEKNITRGEAVYTLKGNLIEFVKQSLEQGDSLISLMIKGKHERPGSRAWVSDKGWVPARLKFDLEKETETTDILEINPKCSTGGKLVAYPNPCPGDDFHIMLPSKDWQTIQVANLSGQIIVSRSIHNENLARMNTSQFMPGYYLIFILKEGQKLSTKILVK